MAISSYISPRVQIQQNFLSSPVSATSVLAPLIIGPQFNLHRYTVAAEQASCQVTNPTTPSLGSNYQYTSTVTYPYPNQEANTTVDLSYSLFGVYFNNVQAQYLPNTSLSSTSANAAAALVSSPSGGYYPNYIRFTTGSGTIVKTANGYNRSSYFSNRDVQIGDYCNVTDTTNNITTSALVTGYYADTTAASTGTVLATSSAGSTNGTTSTFTDATASFTSSLVGQVLTVSTGAAAGIYQILAVPSATTLTLNSIPASATSIAYKIGGVYNDINNIGLQTASLGTTSYTGSGSAPTGVTTTSAGTYIGYNATRILSDTYTASLTATTTGTPNTYTFSVSSVKGAFTTNSVTVPAAFTLSGTVTANTLTTAAAHGLSVGSTVVFSAVGSITGLTANTPYFVIATNFTTTTFSLAASPGGSIITLGGTITGATSAIAVPIDSTGGSPQITLAISGTYSNLVVGNAWSFTAKAATAIVTPTASGTYTGASNIVYKLSVVRGGPFYTGSNSTTCALIAIYSSNVDTSPQVSVASATSFAVGTLGVTAQFASGSANGGLIYGDNYYISCLAAAPGATKGLILNTNLSSVTIASGSSAVLSVVLAEPQNGISIPTNNSSTVNWSATTSGVTINPGIVTSDPLLVSSGSAVGLPIIAANIYISYRDLTNTNAAAIGTITSSSSIASILGTITPDNPIAQGVYNALLNSAGVPVFYLTVNTNDLPGYTTALGIAANNVVSPGSAAIYNLVPLTYNTAIQNAFASHCDTESASTIGKWRVCWLSIPATPTASLYTGTATVSANPNSSTTAYTLFTSSGANFITLGVRAGDSVFFNYTTSATGVVTYTTYTVASVVSQTSLLVTSGLSAPVSVAQQFAIQRNYLVTEQTANIATAAAAYNDRRVRIVFPDTLSSAGVTEQGYLLAAALAGLASGVPPNQGLTNQPVLGFDNLTEALITFGSSNLDTLAANGVFVVTQTAIGATPYVRHQLTSAAGSNNLNTAEDSITRNVDAISYGLASILQQYIGIYNINPGTIRLIKDNINGYLGTLITTPTNATAGTQLLSGSVVTSIIQDPVFFDRLDVNIQLVVPYPLNYLYLTLTVGQSVSSTLTVTTTTPTSAV